VIGQDIFDRNLVPADTDYRIYRDYLNVSGLDFAFIRSGFTYHTPDDDI
jgi:endoplasmic reticulum metallopeptidase, putative